MTGRFGWHSGDVHAKNIQAGTFVISGIAAETKEKAIVFPKRFSNVPKIFLQQQIRTGTLADYNNFGAISGGNYRYPIVVSGTALVVSGATTAGFTTHFVVGADGYAENAGASAVASGVIVDYFAFDFVNKG